MLNRFLLFLCFGMIVACGQQETPRSELSDWQLKVHDIIDHFSHDDRIAIARLVDYPFSRPYPLPAINDELEFLNMFDEIFDEVLIHEIVSSPDDHWKPMGWRGIMFDGGTMWLTNEGHLKTVNHMTNYGIEHMDDVICRERVRLHESLQTRYHPVLHWETNKFRIRIDRTENFDYRYAAWPIHHHESEKPSLVIEKGTYESDGTGGNYHYQFEHEGHIYKCFVFELKTVDDPDGRLIITKDNETVDSQDVVAVVNPT